MQEQLSSILNKPQSFRKHLNILQKFLQNKNKYRQKYLSHVHKQHAPLNLNTLENKQKPKTSAFARIYNGRHNSSDNIHQECFAFLKKATNVNNQFEFKQINYTNSDFNDFLLSEREKLRKKSRNCQSPKVNQLINLQVSTKNLEKELIIKKETRVSIVNLDSIPQSKEDNSLRHSIKQNLEGNRKLQKSEGWRHFKKKKYVDAKFFSIKKFILNNAGSKDPPLIKKCSRNLSDIYLNRIKPQESTLQIGRNRYQQTQILQIDPWEYEPNQH